MVAELGALQALKMEGVVKRLRQQLETVMSQLAQTTAETQPLRQQALQATQRANDAHGQLGIVTQRIQAMEQEMIRNRDQGHRPGREVDFVAIKTMKPPMFRGSADNFQNWAKKAKNYFDANCDGLRDALEKIEFSKERVDEMTVESLGFDDTARIDKKLNQFLLAYTDAAAMTSVKNAHGSRFEAWRKLTAEYDPMSTQAGFSKMGHLMSPTKAKTEHDISMRVEQWEAEERKYNDRTRTKIPEDWRLEILVGMLPTPLEDEFRMRIVTPDSTHSGIRAIIMDHVHRVSSITGRRAPATMDCSALDRKGEARPEQPGAAQGPAGMPDDDHNDAPLWTFEQDPEAPLDFDHNLDYVGNGSGKLVEHGQGRGKARAREAKADGETGKERAKAP